MASELEVGKVRVSPANITAELQLYRDDSTINAAGTAIGDINFGGGDADNDNAARLRVKSDAAWTASSSPTAFEFQTCPSGSESPQTRLTIDSTGNVSVGGNAATKLLTVKKDGGGSQLGIDVHNTGTAAGDDAVISYECQGLAEWLTGIDRSASSFVIAGPGQDLATNPRLTIASTGLATFSNGIAFSQTNSSATGATATGTTLDHYEEGTWTPTYAPSAGSYTSLTMSVTSAKYTRVGDVCYLEAYIETDGTVNTTGGSGNLKVSGLPFTSATGYGASFAVGYAANWGSNDAPLGGYIEAGLAAITLSARSSVDGQQVSINFNNLDTGTDKNRLLFSGSYKVA